MTLTTNKTRMGKRRLEMQELRKDKQITTSKKHDKKCIVDQNTTEGSENVHLQLQKLQERYDKLKGDNEKNLEKIKVLEDKVKVLEKENEVYTSQPKIARTTTGELILFCHEFEFPADNLFDLGEHMYEYHSEGIKGGIECHYCDKTFETKDSVMKHRKEVHREKVKKCVYFSAGWCNYGDELCWFIHQKNEKNQFEEEIEIKCKHCGKGFKLRSELMQHRKKHHSETVPVCTNFVNGNCEFAACWFKHTINEDEELSNDGNMTKDLVEKMEKFAERISQIEQQFGNILK